MMKNTNLEQINDAVLDLVNATSDKQLHSQIVETAKKLVNADYGKFFLNNKDRLKKAYYSDTRIKRNYLLSGRDVSRLLATDKILFITSDELEKWHIPNFPQEIKFLTVIPFIHDKQSLGVLVLYFTEEKERLTEIEERILKLYSHTAVLALTKAQLQTESQKALEIRDRFISLASHELRTPLTSIHGYIQLLHARTKEKQSVESRWIDELYIESIRMTRLVKELLDVNRIKQGQFAFVFSEVPMQEVVSRAIERFRITNANYPFEFNSKLSDQQTLIVGDFDKLVEMVSGLLGNAVKFSKPGEKITITLKDTQGTVALEVRDTGRGISKQDLTAILNGFYKPEYASHIEGMGVGLLLARHIVENHRGKLKITSKENKGTSVTVSLPTIKVLNG